MEFNIWKKIIANKIRKLQMSKSYSNGIIINHFKKLSVNIKESEFGFLNN